MKTNGLINVVCVGSLLMFGCAKTPVAALTSAPAPTGAGTATSPTASSAPATPATGAAGKTAAATSAPATSRPAPSEFVVVRDVEDIHFEFDKYTIRSEDARILARNARWLNAKANANDLLLIEGHCDERGTSEYNLALGERRAKATMTHLIDQGVSARRITTISYGKERPQCTEHQEACWAKNRRAHFLVKRG